ncbi:hypothetical protein F4811DRAFT_405502 [Daldinia bambusicola]|nr:hypothetical protein F4811DRAFT_405502 [Daldinia bambusicola]
MRSSMYRRNGRPRNLRVFIRDDVPDTVDDSDSDSDSDSDGEPDTPSPTTSTFPSSPAATETPAQQIGTPSAPGSSPTETPQPATDAAQSTTPATSINGSPQSTSADAGLASTSLPQSNEPSQAQISQPENPHPIMSKDGVIALGTVGAVIILAAIIFLLWKCRRRQQRRRALANGSSGSSSNYGEAKGLSPFSGFGSFFGFKRMKEEEEQQQPRGIYTTNRLSGGRKTSSKIMDDLMAAAYAAEDGNASQYGVAYMDEKQPRRLSNNSFYEPGSRRSNMPQAAATGPERGSNSLYVNQLLSGFYKGRRVDGLTTPANARVAPPVAPSVAGQTEVTATTESTWRTWGWSQKKPPKESWVDKCIRLGGLR